MNLRLRATYECIFESVKYVDNHHRPNHTATYELLESTFTDRAYRSRTENRWSLKNFKNRKIRRATLDEHNEVARRTIPQHDRREAVSHTS